MSSDIESEQLDVKHEEDLLLPVTEIKSEPLDVENEMTTEEEDPVCEVEHIDIKPDPHLITFISEDQDAEESLDESLEEKKKTHYAEEAETNVLSQTCRIDLEKDGHVGEESYSYNMYNNYNSLINNVCSQTAEKLPKCTICGKLYSCKSHLTQHMRTHTGEKPFTCSICSKSFSNKSNLSVHARLHTGVKSFTCNICSKLFFTKAHLTRHISSVHATKKPFTCDICDKTFYHKCYLIKHKLQLHT